MPKEIKIDTKEVSVIKGQLSKAETAVVALKITDAESQKQAIDVLAKIKSLGKMIRERKEEITKPLNIALKSARELFRPLEEQFDSAEGMLNGKLLTYHRQVEQEAKAKEAKIAEQVEKGKISIDTGAKKMDKIERVETTTKGDRGTFQVRKVKDIEVTDASVVPMQYRVLDMVAIRRDALKGVEIPGVRVIEKEIAASGSY